MFKFGRLISLCTWTLYSKIATSIFDKYGKTSWLSLFWWEMKSQVGHRTNGAYLDTQ
jgi:hypothetical protein